MPIGRQALVFYPRLTAGSVATSPPFKSQSGQLNEFRQIAAAKLFGLRQVYLPQAR
jgi:hypothetical protein